MKTIELDGHVVHVDDEGFMTELGEWTREIAMLLARQEGIEELTERHWAVIDFCRRDFQAKGETPGLRRISKESGVEPKELYTLFSKGPPKTVARIAGLGKPKGCV